jgi:hypothetical protein
VTSTIATAITLTRFFNNHIHQPNNNKHNVCCNAAAKLFHKFTFWVHLYKSDMTFKAKLVDSKRSLKQSSVETYFRNIKRLRKVHHDLPIPASGHKWLLEDKLFEWFDKQPLSVRRHLSTAATVALGVYKKKSPKWTERQQKDMRAFDADRRKRNLTAKQKDKMPKKGWDSLKDAIKVLRNDVKHILTKIDTMKKLVRVQDLVILSLYEDIPLRLDYASLRLGKFKGNCIYKSTKKPRGWHIDLQEYKTAKSLGKRTFKLNSRNQRLLNKFIPAVRENTDHGFLLTNRKGQQMSRQVLSKTLMRITRQRIGKSFSTQLLRILYAMKNRGIIESAKQVSDKLMHSAEQSLQYAKKD